MNDISEKYILNFLLGRPNPALPDNVILLDNCYLCGQEMVISGKRNIGKNRLNTCHRCVYNRKKKIPLSSSDLPQLHQEKKELEAE